MIGVRIDSGPIDVTNDSRNTPRDQWPELVEYRRNYIHRHYGFDCRNIVDWLHDSDHMWQALGYQSLDEMVRKGLGIDPADALLVVEWLRRYRPQDPVGLPDAIEYALRGHGGDRRSKEFQDSNTTLKTDERGAEYTIRRLNRDHPELAQRVLLGELSPHAAAIEAGFRTRKFQLPDDPIAAARYLEQRVDEEWLSKFINALSHSHADAYGLLHERQ